MKMNLSNEILAEIGKITVTSSLIEHSLAEMISKIVTVGGRRRELGTIITAELSFRQLISTLNSLLLFGLEKDHDCVAQFERVKPLLFEAERERNKVVHSVWGAYDGPDENYDVVRIKATAKTKNGLRNDFEKLRLNDLCKITDLIGKAYGQLCIFELNFQEANETL